jgi:hypothetical protein
MVAQLAEPVLTLALGNLQKLSQSSLNSEISAIWGVFTKCKDNLENGHRLENLSWRLWYRSCHPGKNDKNTNVNPICSLTTPMTTNFPARKARSTNGDSAMSVPTREMREQQKMNVSMPNTTANVIMSDMNAINTEMANLLHQNQQPITGLQLGGFDNNMSTLLHQNVLPTTTNQQVAFSTPVLPPIQTHHLNTLVTPQLAYQTIQTLHPQQPAHQHLKPKFFISDDSESVNSNQTYSDKSDDGEDLDSDLDSDCSSDFSDELFLQRQPPIFSKSSSSLFPAKRASLLSVAIQRNAFRKSQSKQALQKSPDENEITQGRRDESVGVEGEVLSESLREGLRWDHIRPFQTTMRRGNRLSGTDGGRSLGTSYGLNYW